MAYLSLLIIGKSKDKMPQYYINVVTFWFLLTDTRHSKFQMVLQLLFYVFSPASCLQLQVQANCNCKVTLLEMSHPYNDKTAVPPGDAFWPFQLFNEHKGPWEGHNNIW